MGIVHLFNKEVIVSRLKGESGNMVGFSTTATVDVAVQELDPQAASVLQLTEERAFVMYSDIEDVEKIRSGDKIALVDDLGTTRYYKIIEKTVKNYGVNQHVESVIVEYDEQRND